MNALRIEHIPSAKERRGFYWAISQQPMTEGMYRAPFQKKRLERVKALLSVMLPLCDRVLEIGCCDGVLTEWMAPRVRHITAVEIAARCIERAQERVGQDGVDWLFADINALLKNEMMATDSFDLVVACEVLEHQPDPEWLVSALAPAGLVLATVPISETPNEDAFDVEAFHNPRKGGDGTGHIWCFRPDTFKALFSKVYWYEEVDGNSAILVGAP